MKSSNSGGLENNPSIFFFPENYGFAARKRKETNGWKIKNATGRFLVQIHPSPFVSKVVCPVPKIAIEVGMFFLKVYFTWNGHANTIISRRACVIIWCPECWKWHFRASRFQKHAPRPPRLMGLMAPCSYSRLFFFNQLPTSNFIETSVLVTF